MVRKLIIFVILAFSISIFAADDTAKIVEFQNGQIYLCKVGENLVVELPPDEKYDIEFGNNQNWMVDLINNIVWMSPRVTGDTLSIHLKNSKSAELQMIIKSVNVTTEAAVKKIIVRQFNGGNQITQSEEKKQQNAIVETALPRQEEKPQEPIENKSREITEGKTEKKLGIKPETVQETQKPENPEIGEVHKIKGGNLQTIFGIQGGNFYINKKNNFGVNGEFIIAFKNNNGLFFQGAAMANSNGFFQRYGQSVGFGIEMKGLGYYVFGDIIQTKFQDQNLTMHAQIRPALRYRSDKWYVACFFAAPFLEDKFTGKIDEVDSSLGIYNKAILHFGFDFFGLLAKNFVINANGLIGSSSVYKVGGGIQYCFYKNFYFTLNAHYHSFGDTPLLLDSGYGNAFEVNAGISFGLGKKDIGFKNLKNRIIFPVDYPIVVQVKQPKKDQQTQITKVVLEIVPTEGCAPLTVNPKVNITGQVSGSKTYDIHLDLNYGNNPHPPNLFTYTYPGTYQARATVKDPVSGQTYVSNVVTVQVNDCGGTKWNITVTAGTGGTVTPGTSQVPDGQDSPNFQIAANAGYEVDYVMVDGQNMGKIYNYQFKTVHENHTLAAFFKTSGSGPKTWTITVMAGNGGTVTPGTTQVADGQDSPNFQIAANSGFEIDYVAVDGANQGKLSSYQFKTVHADHTLAAFFKGAGPTTFSIVSSAGTGLNMSPLGTLTYSKGATAIYTVTVADPAYAINQVLVDGAVVATSPASPYTYTFSDIQANHTINATSKKKQFTITATAGPNGTITPAGTVLVDYGSTQQFVITAVEPQYKIDQVMVDGSPVTVQPSPMVYTFSNVTANHTISVTFKLKTFTITIWPSTGGGHTDPGPSAYTFNYGDSFTINNIPDPGQSIVQVHVDFGTAGAVGSYTFSNITADHGYWVEFSVPPPVKWTIFQVYEVYPISGGPMISTLTTSFMVDDGTSIDYQAPPNAPQDENTVLFQVLLDGQIMPNNFSINNIHSDHEIRCKYWKY